MQMSMIKLNKTMRVFTYFLGNFYFREETIINY